SGSLLPTPLHETGPRIMFIRAGSYPPDKYTFKEIMAVAHAQQELWIREDDYAAVNGFIDVLDQELWIREDDYAAVNGFIDVLDVSRLTAAHLAQHTPNVVKKMLVFAEQAIPLRQRATHFINIPAGFEKVFNMLKPLMPAKQQERLHLHGNNLESLYAHIPQKYLPKEYGGENGYIEEITELSVQFFLNRRDYFIEDHKYRNNEKLRVGKQPDFDSIFGMDGTFRKLDVD
ncbi:PREDICTED: alpha-tocopherol transfer protein-like, partial [Rhagoletis zephyria]|uniref:alpha-tocopherol transfer protein-like n=1 Tax=Rhagoletis zephyria TaxID=28612 RepID=UPI0008115A95